CCSLMRQLVSGARAEQILAPGWGHRLLQEKCCRCRRWALVNNHLAISIQPSRKIHTEHPQDESSREHVQLVQAAATYPPENSVEDSENGNDGNSIGRERLGESVHGMPAPRCYSPDGCGQSDLCPRQVGQQILQ